MASDDASEKSGYTLLDFIAQYLTSYSFIIGGVALLLGASTAFSLTTGKGSGWLVAVTGYTATCAAGLAWSSSGLRAGRRGAPRGVRLSLLATVPASILAGYAGFLFAGTAANGILTRTATGDLAYVITVVGGLIGLAAVANVAILVRLLFYRDLETLSWAHRQESLEVGMNLLEDEAEPPPANGASGLE